MSNERRKALLATHRRTRRARMLRKAQAFDRWVERTWVARTWAGLRDRIREWWPVAWAVAFAVLALAGVVSYG